jgi:hypothetical protein|tara:strand:+ start:2344 stop:4110 length:1767 start_codon:yes stop_codon:yes gene_type:complete
MPLNSEQLYDQIDYLRVINQDQMIDRSRIRDIMNGGEAAVKALLGNQVNVEYHELPAPNLFLTALERFAQKLGRSPDIKVDIINEKDSERARKKSEKLERIVVSYDKYQKLHKQLPQVGRWLPGYGFVAWTIGHKRDKDGNPYPYAELRDPFTCYPGIFGNDQQPKELAIISRVPHTVLAEQYPEAKQYIFAQEENDNGFQNPYSALLDSTDRAGSWANSTGHGKVVVEYRDKEGTYIFLPENKKIIDFMPNILKSGPCFVVAKRYSFDQMQSQFQHITGLMANMAKINILGTIAMEDAVFTETNIVGEIESGKYRKGRFAVNYLTPGSQVSKPVNNLPYQLFQQVDRLERHLRLGAAYPVSDDGQSPNAFVTGRGLEELGQSASLHVREYQTVLGDALEELDAKRLEYDEAMFGSTRKPLAGFHKGTSYKENYTPNSDISEVYTTRRVYGVMAGFDEPQKIITGLQLYQQGIIDKQTLQENMDGLENITKIQNRVNKERAETVLFETLMAQAAQGDQKALVAAIEIRKNPQRMSEILDKYYTAEGEEPSEEELALLNAQAQQAGAVPQGPPPGLAQVLSQVAQQGGQ